MTIKESLIKWLQLFDGFEIEDYVQTDIISEEQLKFALSKEPNIIVNEFADGSEQRTEYYTFQAKLNIVNDDLRKTHDAFLEDFEDWIFTKNINCDYPKLDKNRYCYNISISSPFYLESVEERLGMYIFTIEITYRKEL